ncbi:Nif3-like dinuclear metal center hexameric protein [Thermodesulfobacteriota bacterium]
MVAKVSDIINIMEAIAPVSLAEEWDNVGLQVGGTHWPVRNIWIALDPAPDVVAQACQKDAGLLITHHPLILQPLKSIDTGTSVGAIIQMAIQHHLAIFSAHTNLDSAAGGLNDELATRIGLNNLKVLGKPKREELYKLALFVPVNYEQKILAALSKTRAGRIGEYTCSFRNYGKDAFKPRPAAGNDGDINHTEEIRVETVVKKSDIQDVVEYIRSQLPNATIAYDIYPLISNASDQGLGRVGDLEKSMQLSSLAEMIKKILKIESIRIAGRPDRRVHRAALCTGGGSSLISSFFSSGADVFITGDIRYHDARAVETNGLGLIDMGHFASERLMIDVLAGRLQKILIDNGINAKINKYEIEKDPFIIL